MNKRRSPLRFEDVANDNSKRSLATVFEYLKRGENSPKSDENDDKNDQDEG